MNEFERMQKLAGIKINTKVSNDKSIKSLFEGKSKITKSELKEIIRKQLKENQSDSEKTFHPLTSFDISQLSDILELASDKELLQYANTTKNANPDIKSAIYREIKKRGGNPTFSLKEAKKDEEEITDELEMDLEPETEETTDTEISTEPLSTDAQSVQDSLEKALEGAKAMGDEKLVDQIGNTITFFTRSHIVKENENLTERIVYKTSEFEEIDNAIDSIKNNLYVFENDKEIGSFLKDTIESYLNKIEEYVNTYGTEEI